MTVNDSARILRLANTCIDPDTLVETLWEFLPTASGQCESFRHNRRKRQVQPGRSDQDDSGHRQVPRGAVRDCSGPIGKGHYRKRQDEAVGNIRGDWKPLH